MMPHYPLKDHSTLSVNVMPKPRNLQEEGLAKICRPMKFEAAVPTNLTLSRRHVEVLIGNKSFTGLTRFLRYFAVVFGVMFSATAQGSSAPTITAGVAMFAESRSETSFDLSAMVNPNGSSTNVTFQYSTDATFATNVQSLAPYNIGSGVTAVEIVRQLSGLTATSTWYWRVVAVNDSGTSTSAARQIFKVAVMPSNSQGVKYGKVLVGSSRNHWGKVWGGTAPYTFEFDFGDGSAPATGNVVDLSYIQVDKAYTTAGIKRFTLKVTDANGNIVARKGTIRVLSDQTVSDRVDMAIERGLVNLYRNQTNSATDGANAIYWKWGTFLESHYYVMGTTGKALLAFAENEHLPSEDAVEEIYAPMAIRARNFLLRYATAFTISDHSDGIAVRDSDLNNNNTGVYFDAGHTSYASSIASLGIIMSLRGEAEAKATTVGYGPLANTRNYYELVQDICDQLLWSQGDGVLRGSFEYPLNVASPSRWDGSAMQWPSLVMGAATDRLGLPIPEWFHDNAAYGFSMVTDVNGGVGYSSNSNWVNPAKTGGSLAALSFGERFIGPNPQANLNLSYIQEHWWRDPNWSANHAGWAGQWYAMYGLKKGLQLQNITTTSMRHSLTDRSERNWQQDFNAWLLGDGTLLNSQGGNIASGFRNTNNMFGQLADGSWRSIVSPSDASADNISTASAILIMSEAVTRAVPVAVIEPIPQQTNKPLGRSFEVDGSQSFHTDSSKAVMEYLWDFDASNGLDWNNPDATGAIVSNPGYTSVGTYTITLLVRDNSDPVATSVTQTTVSVTDQDVAPIAIAKPRSLFGPYTGRVGQPIVLDGSESYDPDGDAIVLYEWDLTGDGVYDNATGATTSVTFNSAYEGSIGLRVTANGKVSTNRSTLFIQAGEADLSLVSAAVSNVVENVSADMTLVMKNDPDSGRAFNGIKLRFYNANPYLGGGPLGDTYDVNFTAGQTVTLNLTGLNFGTAKNVWVFLDSDNAVTEFNERNNVIGPLAISSGLNLPQTLCFVAPLEAPASQVLPLFGNTTSGLNVVYTVVSGPGTISGNLLTFSGQGDVVVRASQPGDLTYSAASTVDQTIKSVALEIPLSVNDGWSLKYGTGAASKAQAVAMELSGQVAQHVAVTGYVTGAGGKRDLYVTKRVAATGVEVWTRTFSGNAGLDDEGAAVVFDNLGDVVVAGQTTNAAGNTDIVVLKYSGANGATVWQQIFVGADGTTDTGADGIGAFDSVNRVQKGRKNLAIGPANEVIVGGYVTNASNGLDLAVIKYSAAGAKVWHKTYDGAGGVDFANAVAVDGVGNVYAAGGSRTGAAMSTLDGVTLKYDINGNLVWSARYDNGRPDEVTSLMLDRDGNPVVSGYTQQTSFDMFVVRYNQNVDPGAPLQTTILWESRFDNPNSGSSEAVWDMGMVFGRDVMLAGTSYPNNGVFNAYTMRFKGTCVEGARWDKEFDGVAQGQDQMVSMGADYFGSPVVVGYSQVAGGKFAIETIKYDAESGTMLWSKRYESADGNSEPTAVAVDPSGNVFVVGYTTVAGGATQVLAQNYSPHSNPNRTAQTITFANPGTQLAGTTVLLNATSNSGMEVQYMVVSGSAMVAGNRLELHGAGSVTVRAFQVGSGDFLPAAPVEVTFTVDKSNQTISFNLPAKIKQVNGQWESFPLAGVASSGLPLTYEVVSGPATIVEGGLQLSGVGVVTVRASQIGNSSFDPAVSVERTVTGEVLGTFTILDGFHVNWRDRCRLNVADDSSLANGEAVAVALSLTGNDATAGYVAGFVTGANGRDLYLTKYTHNIATSTGVQSWVRQVNGSANADDEAAAVAVDGNGDVIVAGYLTRAETGGRDVYVAKYNSIGTRLWEYFYHGTGNGVDMGLTLALQGTDFVIVGGRAEGTGTGSDFFAAKLSSSTGVAVWEKEHNRVGSTSDIPARVAVGTDGGVVLAGISGGGSSADAWTIKLNGADGLLSWSRLYNFANRPDAMRGLALDGANNVIVSGYSQGANFDMYTAKYESGTGITIWDKRYDGTFNSSDAAWDVIVDRQGNVLVTGTSYRAAGVRDGMTVKYNGLDGTVAWAKRPFNGLGTTTANDENFSIALDGLGNLVVVGYTESPTTGVDYYVARHLNNGGPTDGKAVGEEVFDGYYEGNDRIYQVKMDPNGAVWMVGYTSTTTGEKRPLVVRLAPGPAPTP